MALSRTEFPSVGVRLRRRPPRRREFALPARPASVAEARRLARDELSRWHADGDSQDTAVLVLSELFTNAVVHTDSASVVWEIRVEQSESGSQVHLEVRGQRPPLDAAERALVPGEECGRGLLLVDAVSSAWGIRDSHDDCWSVWARVPLTAKGGR